MYCDFQVVTVDFLVANKVGFMSPRIPFFGMLSVRSPMNGLLEHYKRIALGMNLIEQAIKRYITGSLNECNCSTDNCCSKDFSTLLQEVNDVEEDADAIKRAIRNHMPSGLFLAVDRTLFFNYTRQQDNILDAGQDSLHWLGIKEIKIPEHFQVGMLRYLAAVSESVALLKPTLEVTIGFVNGDHEDRDQAKQCCRAVRWQHKEVNKMKRALDAEIYNADMEFKDINLLMMLVKDLHSMSHNAEGCADILRAMIAR